MADVGVYTPLCDLDGCRHPQGPEPFEGFLVMRNEYRLIEIGVRVHPCHIHLDQLRRLARER
jgi:hypothetical protein